MPLMSPGGSSPSRPSTTSCSSRSRSACRSSSPSSTPLWLRTRNPDYLRLTKFFGKLFLINFALGLVTGIVQEFQFGMNWSDYSRFVGDIFGAPLAFEALLAFFLESTFLGIWIFGWGRLPEKLHVGAIWLVHIGTVLSAYFILAANSFMQNPVGYRFNPATGRAEMDRLLRRAHQQGAARDLPARHRLGLHGRRRGRHGRRAVADAQARRHRPTRACTARPPGSARSSPSWPRSASSSPVTSRARS